eukprot:90502_1
MTNYRIHLSSFFIVILTYYHSTIALKSALLTPTNKLDNGVSVVELKDTTTVSSNSNTKWSMFPTDNIGYHMKLSLNTSWSFDPINTTTIQIQINSDSQIGNQFRELLISFTQHNNIRFSTLIQIDQTDDHLIYPKCERYPNKQQFADYNIYTLSENNETSDRVQTAMNNTFDSYLLPHIPTPNISYPLTFILHNIPSENILLFSYLNPTANIRTCSFINMFPNIPIDIYLATAYQAQQITILSINITHNIETETTITSTNIPTNTPTNIPSNIPSNSPINNPTISPTNIPSYIPSYIPSNSPMNNPTSNPTVSSTLIAHSTSTTTTSNHIKDKQVEETTSTQIQLTPNINYDSEEERFANVQTDIPSTHIIIAAICCSLCICGIISIRCLCRNKCCDKSNGNIMENESDIENNNDKMNITKHELGHLGVIAESHSLIDFNIKRRKTPNPPPRMNSESDNSNSNVHLVAIEREGYGKHTQPHQNCINNNNNNVGLPLLNVGIDGQNNLIYEEGHSNDSDDNNNEEDIEMDGDETIGNKPSIHKRVKSLIIDGYDTDNDKLTNGFIGDDSDDDVSTPSPQSLNMQ